MTPALLAGLASAGLVGLVAGFYTSKAIERSRQKREEEASRDEASRILARALEESETLRRTSELEGKEEVFRLRESWEQEESRRREESERTDRRSEERSRALDLKFDALAKTDDAQQARAAEFIVEADEMATREATVERSALEVRTKLEAVAGLAAHEAKEQLMDDLVDEARAESANSSHNWTHTTIQKIIGTAGSRHGGCQFHHA